MKILRIYAKLPPLKGGMEQHILTLSDYQVKQGHQVHLVYREGDPNDHPATKVLSPAIFDKVKSKQSIFFILFHLNAIIKLLLKPNERYDLVHIHGDWSSFMFIPLYKRLLGIPTAVASFHGSLANHSSSKIAWLNKVLSQADVVYTTGYEAYDKLSTSLNKFFQPSGISPFFITKEQQESSNGDKMVNKVANVDKTGAQFSVISVGSIVPVKNFEILIDIAQQMPHIQFRLLGDGFGMPPLKAAIEKHNIKNLILLGSVPKTAVPSYLKESDIYLSTSLAEGTPTATLEAMACGLPIITSKVGGIEQIVKDKLNGYTIDSPHDINAYVDAINTLTSNSLISNSSIKTISDYNRQQSKQYMWPEVAKRLTKIMQDV